MSLTKIRHWVLKNNPLSERRFIGSDLKGNLYFESPTNGSRGRRTIEYGNGFMHISKYDSNDIPVECQSWLRHTRKELPTLEEMQRNQRDAKTHVDQ